MRFTAESNRLREGEKSPRAKLTNSEVVQLRTYRAGGWPHAELSLLFGISASRSCEITRGKCYKNAGGPIETGNRQQYYRAKDNPNRKVDPQIAAAIRAIAEEGGWSHAQIAGKIHDTYGVEISKSLVGLVIRGRTKV